MKNLLNKVTVLLCLGNIFLLSACGPIKGYSGPELPPEKIALITVNGPIWEVRVDGTVIDSGGITVLPGMHSISAKRVLQNRYDCVTRSEFDTYGYDYCRDEREKEIKGKSARSCYTSSYTQNITSCRVDSTGYNCELTGRLEANERYQIFDQDQQNGPMVLQSTRSDLINIPCKYSHSWSEREDQ